MCERENRSLAFFLLTVFQSVRTRSVGAVGVDKHIEIFERRRQLVHALRINIYYPGCVSIMTAYRVWVT